jgi:trimeric autotransporter adhesin
VSNGTSGSLRANVSGPVSITDPSLLDFFNASAFTAPSLGQFGNSPRNVIIGPGGHVANASFNRDMRLGSNRAVTLQVNINNLFNTIQWTAIDTNLTSATFGQVTRFAPMRTITANLRFRF